LTKIEDGCINMKKPDEKHNPTSAGLAVKKKRSGPVQEQFDFDLSAPPPPSNPQSVPPRAKKKPMKKPAPKRPSDEVSLLLSCSEVCSLLKISRSTLDRLEKAGSLPGRVKLGGQVRYHRQVIEDWLLSQAGN
jgi:excisionase family DNA binding protein